jgi:pimeloyl-ACP methyl ester carboxylesterase
LVGTAAKFDLEGAGARAVAAGATDEQLAALGTAAVPDAAAMRRLWETILPMYLHAQHRHLAEKLLTGVQFRGATLGPVMGAVATHDVRDRLEQIRVPALVVAGESDFMAPPSLGRALADGLPAATFVEIAGAGHFPFAEEPTQFAAAMQDWLKHSGTS